MSRAWLWSVFLVSCTAGPDGKDGTADAGPDLDADADADADADSDSDTDTTPTTDLCMEQASLSVVSFTATSQQPTTNVALDVTLSGAATVAAACIMDDEPDQIFFAESTVAATEHTLRLSGLLPLESYTCMAAPTCPTMAGPAAVITHDIPQPPSELRAVDVAVNPALGMTGAWTLAPFSLQSFSGQAYLVIWGPDGRVRWWWILPGGVGKWIEARYHDSDGAIVWGGGFDNDGRVRVLDPWEGETWAFAPAGWEQEEFHHDGKRIADGRVMTLEIRENRSGNSTWDGFGIRVADPVTGQVAFDYDSQVAVDAGDLEVAGGFFNTDPYHANWMDWVETADGPEVYVSLCFSQQIMAIDGDNGDTLWILGANEGWNVVDENGDPLPTSALPQCQHGLEATADRHFLVYDNGADRNQSQAQEWFIDPDTRTAQRLWFWTEPGWSDDFLGDIDDLGNGRILLTQAAEFGTNDIVEVDLPTGDVASRLTFTGGSTYRSDRYDGCSLFTAVRECPDLEARYLAVAPLLSP